MKVIDYVKEAGEYIKTSDGSRITASQMLERFLFEGAIQWSKIENYPAGKKKALSSSHSYGCSQCIAS